MEAGQALNLSPRAPVVPTVQTTRDPAMAVLLACLHQDPRQFNTDLLAHVGAED